MPSQSRTKVALFYCIALTIVYLGIELFSVIMFFALSGKLPSLARFKAMQHYELQNYALTTPSESSSLSTPSESSSLSTPSTIYASHPYLGYVYKPNTTLKDIIPITTNIEGFPLEFGKKSEDDYIVAITGGSVAVQIAVAGANQFKNLLEAQLPTRNIRIVPLAIGGYAAPQQLLAATYYLLKGGHIDLLVNLDGFNDVTRGHFKYTPTNIYTSRRGALDYDLAVIGEIALHKRRLHNSTRLANHFTMSYTAGSLWYMFHHYSQTRMANLWENTSRSPEHTYMEQTMEDRILLWKRTSLMLRNTIHAAGGHYIEFVQPNIHLRGSKPLSPLETALAKEGYNGHPAYQWQVVINDGYNSLLKQANTLRSEENLHIYDLSRIFAKTSDTMYIDSCCHFNSHGVSAIVDRMAKKIQSSGLIVKNHGCNVTRRSCPHASGG